MALIIGIVLSAAVAVMARWVGFDRSRAFCAAYDVGAGAWLALLLLRRSRETATTP